QHTKDNPTQDKQVQIKVSSNSNQSIQNTQVDTAKIAFEKSVEFDKVLESKQTAQNSPSNILDQVMKKISGEIGANKSQISMILKPENLGKVDINIISEKGILSAEISAENQQVKDALSKGMETLKQTLEQQGVNVDNITIKVQAPKETGSQQFDMNNNENKSFEQMQEEFANSNSKDSNQTSKSNFSKINYSNFREDDIENTAKTIETNVSNTTHAGLVDYKV
ncbi:MAG: flagellar hook-length control protein FliK, partial [Candidatus Gastranaerophilales bacterium]|nr:flagellar hook-length control protein FliK [Candidatus Gastranaerophilales bacterium]